MTRALEHLGGRMEGLKAWRRALAAFAAGAFSALSFAPVDFFPALLLGYAALVLLLDGASAERQPYRQAAFAGWCFAFGQYLVGLHWLVYPFLVDPASHLWQAPFAILLVPAGLALFAAAAMALALLFWDRSWRRLLAFSLFYAGSEWLRGHVLTGFPWNLPAYGWGALWPVMQAGAVMGAYGLSFLTILFGASLAEFFRRAPKFAPLALFLLFAALWLYGAIRLEAPVAQVPDMVVRLVQPDIPQNQKYVRRYVVRNWQRLLDLSRRPGKVTHIIWPEAAPSFLLDRSPAALEEIASLTGADKTLITGATRAQIGPGRKVSYYNSLYIFGPGGRIDAIYDKFHLVPFGEYLPMAGLLRRIGFTKLTAGETGFSAGDGLHIYRVPGAPDVTPLICYEIIFPGSVTTDQRPGWLVNVTDDSWFGPWAGPMQHLLIARARAIEEGLPVARAANTGISAMIDPYGRLVGHLDLGRMGVVDAQLPRALPPTLYARAGDWIFFALLSLAGLLAFPNWGKARN